MAEKICLLIGSQAQRLALSGLIEDSVLPAPRDWDFVMDLDTAKATIGSIRECIVSLDVELADMDAYTARKFVIRLKSGVVVEIQLAEYERSWKLVPICRTLEIVDIEPNFIVGPVSIPTWQYLLHIKASHFFLPTNWRKSAIGVSSALAALRKTGAIGQLGRLLERSVKQFVSTRMIENYEVFRLIQQESEHPWPERQIFFDAAAADAALLRLAEVGCYKEKPLIGRSASGKCTLEPWSGFSMPENFAELFAAQKSQALSELIGTVCHLLYVAETPTSLLDRLRTRSRRLRADRKRFATEMWLLTLESIALHCVALPSAAYNGTFEHLTSEFLEITTGVYFAYRAHAGHVKYEAAKVYLNETSRRVLEEVGYFWADSSADQLFREEFLATYKGRDWSAFHSILFSNLDLVCSEHIAIPSWFDSLTAPLWSLLQSSPPPAAVSLPSELWMEIFNRTTDHLSLARLSATCRRARNSLRSDDEVWQRAFVRFFGIEDPRKPKDGTWDAAFRDFYLMWKKDFRAPAENCSHCGERHKKVTERDWQEKVQEWMWDWCVCPDCDAGSWRSCNAKRQFLLR